MGYIYLKNVNELHFAGHVVRACSLIKFVTDTTSLEFGISSYSPIFLKLL